MPAKWLKLLITAGALISLVGWADEDQESSEAPPSDPGAPPAAVARADVPPTDITSDTMDFDIQLRQAIFLGNVVVLDHSLRLEADKLTVQFDENNQLQMIEAIGNVIISAERNKAQSGKAIYDFNAGTIILSEQPELMLGVNKIVGAEKIIYDRKAGKFRNEGGQPHIIILDAGGGGATPLDKLIPKEKAEK